MSQENIQILLTSLIQKHGFGTDLDRLREQRAAGEISQLEFQLAIEELSQKLPLEQVEIDRLLELFGQNIDSLVQVPVIIGNGDIRDLADLQSKGDMYGWDGGMIGRGVFENPFAFNPNLLKSADIPTADKLQMLKYHLNLWVKTWGEAKNYQVLKKFFKIYISGFDGAGSLRAQLMATNNTGEALEILDTILGNQVNIDGYIPLGQE